jgi:hypothetical protein
MIVGTPPNWSKGTAELLKQFIESSTGQLFLANLAASRPTLSSSDELNVVALRSKLAGGYEACLDRILSLTEPPVEAGDDAEPDELYPSIDDESKWNKQKKD